MFVRRAVWSRAGNMAQGIKILAMQAWKQSQSPGPLQSQQSQQSQDSGDRDGVLGASWLTRPATLTSSGFKWEATASILERNCKEADVNFGLPYTATCLSTFMATCMHTCMATCMPTQHRHTCTKEKGQALCDVELTQNHTLRMTNYWYSRRPSSS